MVPIWTHLSGPANILPLKRYLKDMKNRKALVTITAATLAMGFVVMAFVANASPYGTVSDAKAGGRDRLHVAGDVIDGSVKRDLANNRLLLTIVDKAGDKMDVFHTGEMPSNLAEVKQVVVVGKLEDGKFHSTEMLVKCPSRYEDAKTRKVKA